MTSSSTAPHHDPPDRSRVDLRLLPAAMVAWLGALLLTPGPAWIPLVVAGCLAGLMIAGCEALRPPGSRSRHPTVAGRRARHRHPVSSHGRWVTPTSRPLGGALPGALLAGGALLMLCLSCGSRLIAREHGGIRDLAAAHATVELRGRVTASAALSSAPGTFRVLLAVASFTPADSPPIASGAAVQLFLPERLTPGDRIVLTARLAPGRGAHDRALATARPTGEVRVRAGPDPVSAVLAGRRTALSTVAVSLPGDAGALLPAVAVGDTAAVGDLDAAMKTAGLAHLTAVSGAHFSMVGAVVLAVASRCGVSRRWRWLPVGGVSIGFVLLVGPGPTVVRAAVMGAVGVLGVAVGRPSRAVPSLLAAVLVLLIGDPWLGADLGFVLSVVATAGIATLAAPLADRWQGRWLPPSVAVALAVPVAAQAACAPVLLLLDPSVSLYAVPANLAAVPAVEVATIGGLVSACCAGWCPWVADWSAAVAGSGCWWIATVARVSAGLPGARVAWLSGWPGLVDLTVATAAGLALLLRCRRGMAP